MRECRVMAPHIDFTRACELQPVPDNFSLLIEALMDSQDYNKALQAVNRAIQKAPNESLVLNAFTLF